MTGCFREVIHLRIALYILPITIITCALDVAVTRDPSERNLFVTQFTQQGPTQIAVRAQRVRGAFCIVHYSFIVTN